ncbi:hypothetical protein WJM97_21955 [Okeanomitos corallinicola TIOX110]|uniref:Uncharacterized protein n=1 Tax=Okeanomitos corallinicola TIOX110 TaxID=3133117 RepID=A0ABZ2USP6_9CYAN
MAERTLQEVLGSGASQTASTIGLSKSDLGLTDANCTADKVIAAIVIKALATLDRTYFDADLTQTVFVEKGFDQFLPRGTNNDNYVVRQITVNLAKLDADATLNPEDY